MDTSVFTDKTVVPVNSDLERELKETYNAWSEIRQFVLETAPQLTEEWNFSGAKFGWSFRIKDKKRVVVYLLPREGYFKVAFVFGQKATDAIMESSVDSAIKTELQAAKVYAEGRGIRLDIRTGADLSDIKRLVEIKLAF